MTTPNNLEIKGDFQKYPFAELLVEVVHTRLGGSLRLSSAKQKSVIYFREGKVVYAVSNAREHRLFSVLLKRRKIDEKTLVQFPNLANDLELIAGLEQKGIFKKSEIAELISMQIESIIIDALTWHMGGWVFNPLAHSREDLVYNIDLHRVLVDYARCLPSQDVQKRLRNVPEAFYRDPQPSSNILLQPHEQYALDCFNGTQLTIREVGPTCSLPETAMLQSLYVLWLGGLLVRRDWNSAFPPPKVDEIRAAKFSLVRSAEKLANKPDKVEEKQVKAPEPEKLPEVQISLEEYLERVEKAETLYDVLGIDATATQSEIKNTYFAMAKMFHPDRFHREKGVKLRRIQVAFTQIAHAYETLKTAESRESYNLKIQKELQFREKIRAAKQPGTSPAEDRTAEQGLGSFEQAMEALNEEEFAAAAGHLARAVHYSPQNALYHAYFGHALSYLDKQQHKAEASLQTAAKLDPKNAKIRMMLVEFFIEMKMAKRAEGELKRFLELVPGNREFERKLAELQPKAETI
jgi:curved DNA-binding protein CbpA